MSRGTQWPQIKRRGKSSDNCLRRCMTEWHQLKRGIDAIIAMSKESDRHVEDGNQLREDEKQNAILEGMNEAAYARKEKKERQKRERAREKKREKGEVIEDNIADYVTMKLRETIVVNSESQVQSSEVSDKTGEEAAEQMLNAAASGLDLKVMKRKSPKPAARLSSCRSKWSNTQNAARRNCRKNNRMNFWRWWKAMEF